MDVYSGDELVQKYHIMTGISLEPIGHFAPLEGGKSARQSDSIRTKPCLCFRMREFVRARICGGLRAHYSGTQWALNSYNVTAYRG